MKTLNGQNITTFLQTLLTEELERIKSVLPAARRLALEMDMVTPKRCWLLRIHDSDDYPIVVIEGDTPEQCIENVLTWAVDGKINKTLIGQVLSSC